MAEYEFIKLERTGAIAVMTLDRPEVLNAWHRPMRGEIIAALGNLDRDETCRAIVVTGSGERAFCAGQDLNEAKAFDPEGARAWIEEWRVLYSMMRNLSKPLVAALNGVAAGSAFQFVLLCDVRVAHPGVRMGQPEINSGIASILGPWIMREVIGLSRTTELTLTGRMMDAEEARSIGLIHHMTSKEKVLEKAGEVARDLASKPPIAMRLDKAWLRDMTQAGFDAAFDGALAAHFDSYSSGEPQQMAEAFLAARRKK